MQLCCNSNIVALEDFMKQLLTLLVFIGLYSTAQATPGDHDHIEFPPETLLALEGQDAISKEECFLFITDLGYEGTESPENFYAKVLTSYSHDHQTAEAITVRAVPGKSGVLSGLGVNGQDQIVIFLPEPVTDLRLAQSFNLKWWHVNHFHNNRCVNLQIHQH